MHLSFIVVFFTSGFALAQACTQGPPTALGTVTQLGSGCAAGSLPLTSCTRLQVDCAGLPPIEVHVRVTEPAAGTAVRGTVLLGTGGGGSDFYGDRPGGPELITALLARGFRCVDRAWTGGWFQHAISIRKQSCRYATLLTWIHQNVHSSGVFCATGNSGGSAELGYALTAWARGDILDVAVPTGGPPMSRLDKICGLDPTWNNACQHIAQPGVFGCGQPACTVQPSHAVCNACSGQATAADLEADSILFPGAVLTFPQTRVHIVLGGDDCSNAVPAGLLFFRAITSQRVLEIAKGTPHWTAQTAEGRFAILRAILGGAACPGVPSTVNAPAWPQLGGNLQVGMHGPATGGWLLALGFGPDLLAVPPLGYLFLAPPSVLAGGGALDPTGLATFTLPVPSTPALTGSCLSNMLRVVVLP